VALIVFADETGTHDKTGKERGSEVAGVAGYAAWAADWEKLCVEWTGVLQEYNVSCFHFREYVDKRNRSDDPTWVYYRWSEDRRKAFLDALAPIPRKYTLFGVASLLSVKDYDQYIPQSGRDWIQHPYFFELLPFYGAVLEELRNRNVPSTKVNFVFDLQAEFERYAVRIFNRVKKEADPQKRMDMIKFSDKRTHVELQVADLLAYRAHQTSWRLVQQLAKMQNTAPSPISGEVTVGRQEGLDLVLELGTHVAFTCDDASMLKRKAKAFLLKRETWDGGF
jgi:hypothetical protein